MEQRKQPYQNKGKKYCLPQNELEQNRVMIESTNQADLQQSNLTNLQPHKNHFIKNKHVNNSNQSSVQEQKQIYGQNINKIDNRRQMDNNNYKSIKKEYKLIPQPLYDISKTEQANNLVKLQSSSNQELFWLCRTCHYKNYWISKQNCSQCSDQRYRLYDRMTKEVAQQDYQFLFFIDYECNNTHTFGFEIIEFPIHVVDVTKQKIVNTFSSFVKPSSSITPFITKLTKITDNKVKNAPLLKDVIQQANTFLQPYLAVGQEHCCVVYDCDSDSSFLFNETNKKNIQLPPIFQKYINLKSVFPAFMTSPPSLPASLSKMQSTLKMKFQGQKHCGADDAFNQASVGIRLLQEGYFFTKQQEIQLGSPNMNDVQSAQTSIEYVINIEFELENKKEEFYQINENDFPIFKSEQKGLQIKNKYKVHDKQEQRVEIKQKQEKNFSIEVNSKKLVKIICTGSQIVNKETKNLFPEGHWEFDLREVAQSESVTFLKKLFGSLFTKLNELNIAQNRFIVTSTQPQYKQFILEGLLSLSQNYKNDKEVKWIFQDAFKYINHFISVQNYALDLSNFSINQQTKQQLKEKIELFVQNSYKIHCPKQLMNNSLALIQTLLKECDNIINISSIQSIFQ